MRGALFSGSSSRVSLLPDKILAPSVGVGGVEGASADKWRKLSILLAAAERLLLIYLLSGFSDWLLSPVVVVSIRGDFFTSILLLVSCKRQETRTERLESVM